MLNIVSVYDCILTLVICNANQNLLFISSVLFCVCFVKLRCRSTLVVKFPYAMYKQNIFNKIFFHQTDSSQYTINSVQTSKVICILPLFPCIPVHSASACVNQGYRYQTLCIAMVTFLHIVPPQWMRSVIPLLHSNHTRYLLYRRTETIWPAPVLDCNSGKMSVSSDSDWLSTDMKKFYVPQVL